MVSNTLLKVGTGVVAVALLGAIGWEIAQSGAVSVEKDEEVASASRTVAGVFAGDGDVEEEAASSDEPSDGTVSEATSPGQVGGRLSVGIMGSTPTADQIPTIKEIPWLTSQVNRVYAAAKPTACTLIPSETPVAPILSTPPPGSRGNVGRLSVLTVGLETDEDARSKLPAASKSAIVGYLRDHRLAVQPMLYQSEAGKLYFGADCRAAFYLTKQPDVTVEPEPMIGEAVGRFRVLGVLGGDLAADGRTLLLAFQYVKTSERLTTTSGTLAKETELLFLHLPPDATPSDPQVVAFVTSEGRQKLHRLNTDRNVLISPVATITASIRFDSFVLMGLYPANPVVTGVRQHANSVLPLEAILARTRGADESTRLSFEQVLDRFSEFSDEASQKSGLAK